MDDEQKDPVSDAPRSALDLLSAYATYANPGFLLGSLGWTVLDLSEGQPRMRAETRAEATRISVRLIW